MMQIIHFNSLSDNNILFFSKVGDNYKVELIDTKKLSINKSLDIPHKIKVGGYSYQIDYINSFIINDNLYVFYKLYDRNKKGNALWYNVYDGKNLNMVQEYTELAFYQFDTRDKMLAGDFEVYINPFKTIFFISQPIPRHPYEREKLKYTALDTDFNILWEKDVDFKYLDKDLAIQQISIDNVGNAFILLNNLLNKNIYQLISITDEGKKINNIMLSSIMDVKCLSPRLYPTENGTFIISFKGDLENEVIDNLLFYKYDVLADSIQIFSSIPLTKTFLSSNFLDKGKKTKAEIDERKKFIEELAFAIDTVIFIDEDIYLIAEKRFNYQDEYMLNDPQTGTQRVNVISNYNAQDIYVFKINNKGKLIWTKKINKYQTTNNDNLSFLLGYSFGLVNDIFYFVFNDNINNNEGNDILEAPLSGNESCITLATIDKDGNIIRNVILSYNDINGAMIPSLSLVQASGDLFLSIAPLRKSVSQFTKIKECYFLYLKP
jgi:hypothetical protein